MRDVGEDRISVAEAASLLFVTPATVKNWIRNGRIGADGDTVSRETVEKIAEEIRSGCLEKLVSRRNKRAVRGHRTYEDYILDDGYNLAAGAAILSALPERISDDEIRDVIGKTEVLLAENTGRPSFVPYQDFLGFLYLSMKASAERKCEGAYYTPQNVVSHLFEELERDRAIAEEATSGEREDHKAREERILDPCCGTGNFLLEALRRGVPMENLYGMDKDPLAVEIAKKNLRLNGIRDEELLERHVRCGDALRDTFPLKFDLVIGNPPWGYVFSGEEEREFRTRFETASRRGSESYDLFLERAMQLTARNGRIALVLPEALLNVRKHHVIRERIRRETDLRFVEYIGNAFSGVSCPVILLGLKKRGTEHPENVGDAVGCRITNRSGTWTIRFPRNLEEDYWNLDVTDSEERILREIREGGARVSLKGHADFAMGIVTGSNREFLSGEKVPGSEMVLRGCDLEKYRYRESGLYLRYEPDRLQQAAKECFYRAKEKLVYRFIGTEPVFAYDDQGLLTLNSANIVIPHLDGLDIRYILAVLNSDVVSYWCRKKYRSVKLLRSHIEGIPIPYATGWQQWEIAELVERILHPKTGENSADLQREINRKICDLYEIGDEIFKQSADIASCK